MNENDFFENVIDDRKKHHVHKWEKRTDQHHVDVVDHAPVMGYVDQYLLATQNYMQSKLLPLDPWILVS